VADSKAIQAEHQNALRQLEAIGGLSIVEINDQRRVLQTDVDALKAQLVQERAEIEVAQRSLKAQTDEALRTIVETRETALLQEVGIYDYRHPLTDAVAYEKALDRLQDAIKAAAKKEDGGAILAKRLESRGPENGAGNVQADAQGVQCRGRHACARFKAIQAR
jgi:hypothetical protein